MPQCDLYTWQDELAAGNAVDYVQVQKGVPSLPECRKYVEGLRGVLQNKIE